MRAWIGHHVRSLVDASKRLGATPLVTALSLLMIASSVALPVGAYVVLQNTRSVAARVAGDPQMSVFLAPEATRADVDRVGAKLRAAPLAAKVVFVGKDDALAAMKRSDAFAPAIATLKENPLPDAFIVHLKTGSPGAAEALAESVRGESKVGTVLLDAAWLKRLDAMLALIGTGVAVLAAVLAAALVTVIFGTIRSQLAGRVDEIAVSRLVGATDRWIRRPFLYVGGLLGFLGTLGALAIVQVSLLALDRPVRQLAALYESEYSLTSIPLILQGEILIFGTGLGVIGAFLAASEFLRKATIR